MTERDREVAGILKRRLSETVELIDLRAFGSRARGEGDEYSDLDVFVETPFLTKELREKIYDIVWEVGLENFTVISPLIFTREEVESSPLRSSPILATIMEEGLSI
jgi:predicted nucleotidyltransferase